MTTIVWTDRSPLVVKQSCINNFLICSNFPIAKTMAIYNMRTMIKIFRRIRQRLLTENNFSKYLLYAIGEIVLVIIGILIALQINNWNINKSQEQESVEFISRLQKEIGSNIRFVNEEMVDKENQIRSSLSILNMFDQDITELSSRTLDSLVNICMTNSNVEIKVGTLNEGLNTGKLALVKSDSLKSLLYSLPSRIEEIRIMEKYNNDDLNEYFYPFIYKNISFRQMDGVHSPFAEQIGQSKFISHNNLNVLNMMEFENLIDNRYYNSNTQYRAFSRLKNELENLHEMMDRYH